MNVCGNSNRAVAHAAAGYGLATKTANIIGTRVVNRQNEDLGKVEEVLIDVAHARIGYLVLSFCRVPGVGERRYAIPWKAMQHDDELNAYVLNVTRDQIRHAATIDEETRPEFTDASGKRKAHVYCELPHFWMP